MKNAPGTALLRSALEKGWDAGIERMTKSGLIQRLAAANPYLHARDIERIVDTVFDQIGSALARGARVDLRGFRRVLHPRAWRTRRAQPAQWQGGSCAEQDCAALQARQRAARAPQSSRRTGGPSGLAAQVTSRKAIY